MLGLATHEPYFTIIREEFKPYKPRRCDICGQLGHDLKDCRGLAKENISSKKIYSETRYIFLHLSILREYLYRDLQIDCELSFQWNLERAIDDWVFMCFFVGNDFLPHLPSLEIREDAIDNLVRIYKENLPNFQGYLTENGIPNMERVEIILTNIGKMEDEIFMKRHESDQEQRHREHYQPPNKRPRYTTEFVEYVKPVDDEEHNDPNDTVRLWEEGWRRRYYKNKFHIKKKYLDEFRIQVAHDYARGLCWVLQYYYQGIPAWDWYVFLLN